MAYNLSADQAAYRVKLTAVGRQLLAQGKLGFTGFAVGDSEVNYKLLGATGLAYDALKVLRPVDNQPDLKYPIPPAPGASIIAPLSGKVGEQHVIRNVAPSRGPFRVGTANAPLNTLDTTLPATVNAPVNFVKDAFSVLASGTKVVDCGTTTPKAAVGDWLLVHWIPPQRTSVTAPITPTYLFSPTNPGVYLLYRITVLAGASLTLDREVPRYVSASRSPAFVLPGGEAVDAVYGLANSVNDWNEDTLAFVPTPPVASSAVGVWNFNVVYGDPVLGSALNFPFSSYGSNAYLGARTYLGYPSSGAPIALVHYSNHVVHNLYGESLVPETVKLTLPTVLWWGDPTGGGGLVLTTSPVRQLQTGGSATFQLVFHELQDPQGRGVGRVYPSQKLLVLDDPELIAALSAKSNRNWTLPPFDYISVGSAAVPVNGRLYDLNERYPDGDLDGTKKTLHVSYALLENRAKTWDASVGYGYRSGLPCQYISHVDQGLNEIQYFEFKFSTATLAHLKVGASMTGGGGYTAQKLVLLYQETKTGGHPSADAWIPYDITSQLIPAPVSQGAIDPVSLGVINRVSAAALIANSATVVAAVAASSTTVGYYNLNELGDSTDLSFGEERVLVGNVDASIEAIAFRTSFLLNLPEATYATSTNPTWDASSSIAISELGIYDSDDNLVAIGKTTYPLEKVGAQPLFLEVSLDF